MIAETLQGRSNFEGVRIVIAGDDVLEANRLVNSMPFDFGIIDIKSGTELAHGLIAIAGTRQDRIAIFEGLCSRERHLLANYGYPVVDAPSLSAAVIAELNRRLLQK